MSSDSTNEALRQIIRRALRETSLHSTNPRSARHATMPPKAKNQADNRDPADEEVLQEFRGPGQGLDSLVDDPGAMHPPLSRHHMVPPPISPHGARGTRSPSVDEPEPEPPRRERDDLTASTGDWRMEDSTGGYSETDRQRERRIAREARAERYQAERDRMTGTLSGNFLFGTEADASDTFDSSDLFIDNTFASSDAGDLFQGLSPYAGQGSSTGPAGSEWDDLGVSLGLYGDPEPYTYGIDALDQFNRDLGQRFGGGASGDYTQAAIEAGETQNPWGATGDTEANLLTALSNFELWSGQGPAQEFEQRLMQGVRGQGAEGEEFNFLYSGLDNQFLQDQFRQAFTNADDTTNRAHRYGLQPGGQVIRVGSGTSSNTYAIGDQDSRVMQMTDQPMMVTLQDGRTVPAEIQIGVDARGRPIFFNMFEAAKHRAGKMGTYETTGELITTQNPEWVADYGWRINDDQLMSPDSVQNYWQSRDAEEVASLWLQGDWDQTPQWSTAGGVGSPMWDSYVSPEWSGLQEVKELMRMKEYEMDRKLSIMQEEYRRKLHTERTIRSRIRRTLKENKSVKKNLNLLAEQEEPISEPPVAGSMQPALNQAAPRPEASLENVIAGDRTRGNAFRDWVNTNYGDQLAGVFETDERTRDLTDRQGNPDRSLGRSGNPSNAHMQAAWDAFGQHFIDAQNAAEGGDEHYRQFYRSPLEDPGAQPTVIDTGLSDEQRGEIEAIIAGEVDPTPEQPTANPRTWNVTDPDVGTADQTGVGLVGPGSVGSHIAALPRQQMGPPSLGYDPDTGRNIGDNWFERGAGAILNPLDALSGQRRRTVHDADTAAAVGAGRAAAQGDTTQQRPGFFSGERGDFDRGFEEESLIMQANTPEARARRRQAATETPGSIIGQTTWNPRTWGKPFQAGVEALRQPVNPMTGERRPSIFDTEGREEWNQSMGYDTIRSPGFLGMGGAEEWTEPEGRLGRFAQSVGLRRSEDSPHWNRTRRSRGDQDDIMRDRAIQRNRAEDAPAASPEPLSNLGREAADQVRSDITRGRSSGIAESEIRRLKKLANIE